MASPGATFESVLSLRALLLLKDVLDSEAMIAQWFPDSGPLLFSIFDLLNVPRIFERQMQPTTIDEVVRRAVSQHLLPTLWLCGEPI